MTRSALPTMAGSDTNNGGRSASSTFADPEAGLLDDASDVFDGHAYGQ